MHLIEDFYLESVIYSYYNSVRRQTTQLKYGHNFQIVSAPKRYMNDYEAHGKKLSILRLGKC